jgi:hypothetical protein
MDQFMAFIAIGRLRRLDALFAMTRDKPASMGDLIQEKHGIEGFVGQHGGSPRATVRGWRSSLNNMDVDCVWRLRTDDIL